MAKILFECADEDKALWVESATSERLSLSAWIRRTLAERVNGGALAERDKVAEPLSQAKPSPETRGQGATRPLLPVVSRSASAKCAHPLHGRVGWRCPGCREMF